MSNEIDEFRKAVDLDDKYQAKRKLLVVVCLIFIAMNLSGAKLEEANTFIFKLTFENSSGISYFFLLAVIFLTFRYYQHANKYHIRLYDFWTAGLISDYRICSICYNTPDQNGKGLLDDIKVIIPDECIRQMYDGNAKFESKIPFVRRIKYTTKSKDPALGDYEIKYFTLNPFKEYWTFKKHIRLIYLELGHQVDYFMHSHENLDLLAPYYLSLASIISFILQDELLAVMRNFSSA